MKSKLKTKKCANCRCEFTPERPMQKVCCLGCAAALAKKKREKVERANDRQNRKQLKTRSQWMKEAQIAFNAFIRERDRSKPCICCGLPLAMDAVGGGFDCGHYRSVGSAPHLRFDERNAHGQRKQCNRYGGGRVVDYRIGLVLRFGKDFVEALEADQTEKKYTVEDLKSIKALYQRKRRKLINGEMNECRPDRQRLRPRASKTQRTDPVKEKILTIR